MAAAAVTVITTKSQHTTTHTLTSGEKECQRGKRNKGIADHTSYMYMGSKS
jgi:hypothetical protein